MNSQSTPTFFSNLHLESINVIDASIKKDKYVPIDLSVTNNDLKSLDVDCYHSWDNYIKNYLRINNAEVAFGGYLEQRDLYNRSEHFNTVEANLKRNIHLGLDLWVSAGTTVLAAFDGEVHSFKNNTNHGDYGPTIVLKHNIFGVILYTLYGHLSTDSLIDLKVGDSFKQGETIGRIGVPEVNGEYAPHLHFQVINNMQDKKGDYPGVSNAVDLDFYKNNCPDPNIILGLDVNKKVVKHRLEKALHI